MRTREQHAADTSRALSSTRTEAADTRTLVSTLFQQDEDAAVSAQGHAAAISMLQSQYVRVRSEVGQLEGDLVDIGTNHSIHLDLTQALGDVLADLEAQVCTLCDCSCVVCVADVAACSCVRWRRMTSTCRTSAWTLQSCMQRRARTRAALMPSAQRCVHV